MGLWLAIGIGTGAALGSAFDALALGFGFGAILGAAFGVVSDKRALAKKNARSRSH
ncbi:hypothetical protein R6242_19945 [Iodobacter sp. CM08]|uniref:hypothetical protein n=1 Tax=Iodobacter sp. CM08 TaxID=3085902 RepID=UPI002981E560|nr:hypothetical protein [Iodobacter sp. CM08]MDW5418846.1 hypothetical protein [Iodobacter sp. CM08]